MLWVGGHILLVGVDDLGWHALYDSVHHAEEAVGGGALGLGRQTLASARHRPRRRCPVVAVVTGQEGAFPQGRRGPLDA